MYYAFIKKNTNLVLSSPKLCRPLSQPALFWGASRQTEQPSISASPSDLHAPAIIRKSCCQGPMSTAARAAY